MSKDVAFILHKNMVERLNAERDRDIYRKKYELIFDKLNTIQQVRSKEITADKILEKVDLLITKNEIEKKEIMDTLIEIKNENEILKQEIKDIKERNDFFTNQITQLNIELKKNDVLNYKIAADNKTNIELISKSIQDLRNETNHLFSNISNYSDLENGSSITIEQEIDDTSSNASNESNNEVLHNPVEAENIWDAISKGSLDSVKYWLKNRPLCINQEGSHKYHQDTPLQLAAYKGESEIAQFLLDNNADPDVINRLDQQTALHYAVLCEREDIVQMLIDYNANIEIPNKMKMRPVHIACKKGYRDILEILIAGGATYKIPCENDTVFPLHLAALKGRLSIVEYLDFLDEDLEIVDSNHNTPLHLATFRGHIDVVNFLIQKGVNINPERLDDLDTPLHLASYKGYSEICTLLIENGANIMSKNKDRNTPLHLAAFKGRYDTVITLVNNGAIVNVENDDNELPVDMAKYGNHYRVINFLSFHN